MAALVQPLPGATRFPLVLLGEKPRRPRFCPYRTRGRLLTGPCVVICVLAEGSCPFQVIRRTTADRYTALCPAEDKSRTG